MPNYILKRLLQALPTLVGVISTVFLIIHLTPGDPAQTILGEYATKEQVMELREQLGLNRPLAIQYVSFVLKALTADFGVSLTTQQPVITETLRVFPYTLELCFAGILISLVIGIPAGVVAATHRNTVIDNTSMAFAVIGISPPVFWLGLALIYAFSVKLRWFPAIGAAEQGDIWGLLHHLVLPAVCIGVRMSAVTARIVRSSMLEVLTQEYIRTARAKGLREALVVYKHALKNACIPLVTVVGLNMGVLMGGALIIETVFARPGIGKLVVDAIFARDYPQVQGTITLFAASFILINLICDIAYAFLDPRIRYR
jgi:peptide/nickel transport system permease protein